MSSTRWQDMDLQLHELEKVTNNFSEEQKVGSGGYGDVYRGVYHGEEIAVKKLHPLHGLNDKQFHSEFKSLSKIHHRNIVRIIGYCYEVRKKYIEHNGQHIFGDQIQRVLCFEYMQGGSLDKHISDKPCDLDWPTCYKIIKGTCQGLHHLHTEQGGAILHLDMKPHNILLDEHMTAKIADLGLSRLVVSSETHRTETREGTNGYMPPEYIDSGLISKKFDIFSLGVIILKIMAGNKVYSRRSEIPQEQFIDLVTKNWKERLQGTLRHSSEEIAGILQVKTCVEIALRCVVVNRKKRPHLKDIMAELEQLEAEIKKMSLTSAHSKDLIDQRSSDSNFLSVDPSHELRFLFEPGKDITCCLQLTNKTDGFIAYNTKIDDKTKYCTKPCKGIIVPRSKCYISVKLQAQELAPPNMQCHDKFFLHSVHASEGMTSDDITEEFFENAMMVDEIKMPIVYVDL